MKPFSYLKKHIEYALEEQTYNEADFEGETYKEIMVDDDRIDFLYDEIEW